ncbi:four helix bundle protein [Sulfurovum riftiae]|uniref:Four helix bundle protein n=1 Tax=Sulfurovum riftiae TaxID=1630136 RepID=A0A151CF25_9BACT|nr:four helix bundle protein [Sulfurovum riftiae]KYJ86116.1 four helix bundle protein [Sulfurovum riftiae]
MSILEEKSYNFSIRIVKCNEYLQQEKKEFILSKQLLRSGTAIGALIAEGKYAQSKLDFINKLSISLKEANETKYWLRLLKDCNYLQEKLALSLLDDIEHLLKILASSIKTAKENINNAS